MYKILPPPTPLQNWGSCHAAALTFYCSYEYCYPIGIALLDRRLKSLFGL